MRRMILGMLLTLLCAAPSFSATISIRPVLSAVLNEDFTLVDSSLYLAHDPLAGATLVPREEKYVLLVDVIMNISDLQVGQLGFGSGEFNINVGGVVQNVDIPGWAGDASQIDINGSLPGGAVPKWADNLDAGPSGTDLQGIIFGTDPSQFRSPQDPRRTLGIPPYLNDPTHADLPGEYVGTVYLDYPGNAGLLAEIEIIPVNGAVYNAQGEFIYLGVTLNGGRLTLPIPEPSAVLLLAACAIVIVPGIRRRLAVT